MNLVPAKIVSVNGGLKLDFEGRFQVPVPEKPGAAIEAGMEVIMGLRTEDLLIDSRRFPEDWRVESVVEVVEPLGSETLVHVDLRGTAFIAKSEGRRLIRRGDRLQLAMNLEHLHIFNAERGESIY